MLEPMNSGKKMIGEQLGRQNRLATVMPTDAASDAKRNEHKLDQHRYFSTREKIKILPRQRRNPCPLSAERAQPRRATEYHQARRRSFLLLAGEEVERQPRQQKKSDTDQEVAD